MNCQLTLQGQLISAQRLGRSRRHGVLVGVSAPAPSSSATASSLAVSVATASFGLVRLSDVKGGHVDKPGVSAYSFTGMFLEVMRLEVHFRLKHDKLLFQALAVGANVVVLLEVLFQGVVVEVIVRLSRIAAVADEATLVLHAAMLVQLVVVVEALATETTQGVALEAGLVGGAGLIVAASHVFLQLLVGKELVLVREDLLVASAQVAHSFAMD